MNWKSDEEWKNANMAMEDTRAIECEKTSDEVKALQTAAEEHAENVHSINAEHAGEIETLKEEFNIASEKARQVAENEKNAAIQATEAEAARQQEAALGVSCQGSRRNP